MASRCPFKLWSSWQLRLPIRHAKMRAAGPAASANHLHNGQVQGLKVQVTKGRHLFNGMMECKHLRQGDKTGPRILHVMSSIAFVLHFVQKVASMAQVHLQTLL
jgi:cytochrome c2